MPEHKLHALAKFKDRANTKTFKVAPRIGPLVHSEFKNFSKNVQQPQPYIELGFSGIHAL